MSVYCVTKKPMTLEEFHKLAHGDGFRIVQNDGDMARKNRHGGGESTGCDRLQDVTEVRSAEGDIHVHFSIWGDCERFVTEVVGVWTDWGAGPEYFDLMGGQS